MKDFLINFYYIYNFCYQNIRRTHKMSKYLYCHESNKQQFESTQQTLTNPFSGYLTTQTNSVSPYSYFSESSFDNNEVTLLEQISIDSSLRNSKIIYSSKYSLKMQNSKISEIKQLQKSILLNSKIQISTLQSEENKIGESRAEQLSNFHSSRRNKLSQFQQKQYRKQYKIKVDNQNNLSNLSIYPNPNSFNDSININDPSQQYTIGSSTYIAYFDKTREYTDQSVQEQISQNNFSDQFSIYWLNNSVQQLSEKNKFNLDHSFLQSNISQSQQSNKSLKKSSSISSSNKINNLIKQIVFLTNELNTFKQNQTKIKREIKLLENKFQHSFSQQRQSILKKIEFQKTNLLQNDKKYWSLQKRIKWVNEEVQKINQKAKKQFKKQNNNSFKNSQLLKVSPNKQNYSNESHKQSQIKYSHQESSQSYSKEYKKQIKDKIIQSYQIILQQQKPNILSQSFLNLINSQISVQICQESKEQQTRDLIQLIGQSNSASQQFQNQQQQFFSVNLQNQLFFKQLQSQNIDRLKIQYKTADTKYADLLSKIKSEYKIIDFYVLDVKYFDNPLKYFINFQWPSLISITFSYCNIIDSGFIDFLYQVTKYPNLIQLNFPNNLLQNKWINAFLQSRTILKNLKKIDFSYNMITMEGYEILCQKLSEHVFQNLTTIIFDKNNVSQSIKTKYDIFCKDQEVRFIKSVQIFISSRQNDQNNKYFSLQQMNNFQSEIKQIKKNFYHYHSNRQDFIDLQKPISIFLQSQLDKYLNIANKFVEKQNFEVAIRMFQDMIKLYKDIQIDNVIKQIDLFYRIIWCLMQINTFTDQINTQVIRQLEEINKKCIQQIKIIRKRLNQILMQSKLCINSFQIQQYFQIKLSLSVPTNNKKEQEQYEIQKALYKKYLIYCKSYAQLKWIKKFCIINYISTAYNYKISLLKTKNYPHLQPLKTKKQSKLIKSAINFFNKKIFKTLKKKGNCVINNILAS